MKILTEKEAESFLSKQSFTIAKTSFIKSKKEIEKIKIKFPFVMKASGKKIIHKKKLNGVFVNIKNKKEFLTAFSKLKKIKGTEEILIQEQLKGLELFFGIKKTPEFGHVLVFGQGGSKVETKKDVSFRVFPITKQDALSMIKNTKISSKIKEKETLIKILLNLSNLIKKYPKISELDINPLIDKKIVDARIIFD